MGLIKRFIMIDEVDVFIEDIQKMDKEQIKTITSFVDNERDLNFIRTNCNEDFHHIIDNLLYKL